MLEKLFVITEDLMRRFPNGNNPLRNRLFIKGFTPALQGIIDPNPSRGRNAFWKLVYVEEAQVCTTSKTITT
jgi:hypothetical protein